MSTARTTNTSFAMSAASTSALAAVLIVAFITLSRPTIIAASVASLLYGIPHLVFHIANTDGLSNSDIAISLGGLALFAVVPIALIVVSNRFRCRIVLARDHSETRHPARVPRLPTRGADRQAPRPHQRAGANDPDC